MSDQTPNPKLSFSGIREAAGATNTPVEILLRARSHPECPRGLDGFHASGRVHWRNGTDNTLEKWIAAHREELESVSQDTREQWLTRRDRANALLAELELEEKYKRVVNKDLVREYEERKSAALVSLFNSKLRQELPDRLNLPPEKIVEIDKVVAELCEIISTKGISSWK